MSIVFSTSRRPTKESLEANPDSIQHHQPNEGQEQKRSDVERESNHARINKPKSSTRQDKGKAKVIGYV